MMSKNIIGYIVMLTTMIIGAGLAFFIQGLAAAFMFTLAAALFWKADSLRR